MDWQRSRHFVKETRAIPSIRNSKTYLHLIISTGFFAMQCFLEDQQKKDGRDFKPDTVKFSKDSSKLNVVTKTRNDLQ